MNNKNTININDMNSSSNNTVESFEEISFSEIDDIRKTLPTPEHIGQTRYVMVKRTEMVRAYAYTVLEPVPYCHRITLESAYDDSGELRWMCDAEVTAEGKFRVNIC